MSLSDYARAGNGSLDSNTLVLDVPMLRAIQVFPALAPANMSYDICLKIGLHGPIEDCFGAISQD